MSGVNPVIINLFVFGVYMKLVCKDIKKSFKDSNGEMKKVLDGISCEVVPGSITMLKGPSGSGKSTLMNILSGLLIPEGGTVYAGEQCISILSEVKRDRFRLNNIGYVFQTFNLLSQLTVLENVMLPSLLGSGLVQGHDEGKAREILVSLGLKGHIGKYPYQLSVGQRQRVAIARVLLLEPPFILADEPTASLDIDSADVVKKALLGLTENGSGVMLASHDQLFSDIAAAQTIYIEGEKNA